MPGTEPRPNEGQVKQAFYDSVTTSWCEHFEPAGHLCSSMTLARVLRCFCQQEKLAVRRQDESKRTQNKKTIDNVLEPVLMLAPVLQIKNVVLVDQANQLLMRKLLLQETNMKLVMRTHVQFTTMITHGALVLQTNMVISTK
jgi:hypothetical protein